MILRFFLSLTFATALSYVFYDFVYNRIFLAILIWIVSYILSWKMLKAVQNRSKQPAKSKDFAGFEAEKAVKQGMDRLRNIRNNTMMITSNDVASEIRDICKTGTEIFDYIQKNPDDLKKAKQFINYYLDATEKIVKRYVELSSNKDKSPEIENSLKKVEEMLQSINETYRKQLDNLLEDDLLDLNTEIKVLESTMKMENN